MSWLLIDIVSFLLVVLITGVLIPQILLIAFRRSLFDEPDERKIHKLPIPRLGGIAFLPSIFFTVMLVCGLGMVMHAPWLGDILHPEGVTQGFFLGCGMLALYVVGIADDLIGIRYRAKFIVQVLAALLLVASGLIIDNLHGLFGIEGLPLVPAILLTVLVIVFVTNAINLIDGIDGLASGLSAIACVIYGYICMANGAYIFSLIAFCTFGALLSFFCFNVFGNVEKHKKIFMGDTGSLTIGIVLSALSLRVFNIEYVSCEFNTAVLAFAPLLVPCLDVVRVYLHRIRCHASPFLPDKNHIHHKFLAVGFQPRQAMISIVSISALLSLANIALSAYMELTWLFVADIVVWTLFNVILRRRINKLSSATRVSPHGTIETSKAEL